MRSKVNWSAFSFCASADIFSCFERRYPTYIVMNLRSRVFFVNEVPTFVSARGLQAKSRQHFSGVILRFWFENDRSNGSRFIDEEGGAVRPFVLLAHELFQAPNAEGLVKAVVFVASQIKGDAVFVNKLEVLGGGVGAHAQHFDAGIGELAVVLREVARLSCASRSHVSGIEIEGQFLARVVRQGPGASIL